MIAGICGILSLNSGTVDPDRLSVMTQYFDSLSSPVEYAGGWYCIAQAGYNSTGYEGVCLLTESNITVCFEGRIDNRRSLIQQLEEEASCSYARLILRAYQKWNAAFANHILGAFTCVLIDNNLEVRHPYLDRRLLDFGLSVPPEFKFEFHQGKISHYGSRKVLQRKGLKGIVPPEILESQIKATYGSPVVRRLKAYLPQVFAQSRQSLVAEFGIIQAEKFREAMWRVISDENISDADEILPWLDAVLHLELWLQANFEEIPSTRFL